MCVLVFVETEELFPVQDATTFFTDMHRILRIMALGNVRTLCHRRLKLLEQANLKTILDANIMGIPSVLAVSCICWV